MGTNNLAATGAHHTKPSIRIALVIRASVRALHETRLQDPPLGIQRRRGPASAWVLVIRAADRTLHEVRPWHPLPGIQSHRYHPRTRHASPAPQNPAPSSGPSGAQRGSPLPATNAKTGNISSESSRAARGHQAGPRTGGLPAGRQAATCRQVRGAAWDPRAPTHPRRLGTVKPPRVQEVDDRAPIPSYLRRVTAAPRVAIPSGGSGCS